MSGEYAEVAELVDALDSKSSSGNRVGVRFPPSVLKELTVDNGQLIIRISTVNSYVSSI